MSTQHQQSHWYRPSNCCSRSQAAATVAADMLLGSLLLGSLLRTCSPPAHHLPGSYHEPAHSGASDRGLWFVMSRCVLHPGGVCSCTAFNTVPAGLSGYGADGPHTACVIGKSLSHERACTAISGCPACVRPADRTSVTCHLSVAPHALFNFWHGCVSTAAAPGPSSCRQSSACKPWINV